ncbi:MAG: hypothetical protein ACT4P7_21815 [Gemmatimonadaceae bacterium]
MLALVAIAVLTSCAELPTPPIPGASEAAPSLDVSASAITAGASLSQEYSWAQGLAPTSMGSTYQRACFLVYIGGTFDAATDSVQVYKSGATWYLGGTAQYQQQGVRAKARCYSGVNPSATEWRAAPNTTVTMYGPPSVCGLTGVRGHFGTWADMVHIGLSAGTYPNWWLYTNVSNVGPGVRYIAARARCLSPITYFTKTGYAWNGPLGQVPPPTKLWSTIGDAFCYLTHIAGTFSGSELLWVYPSANSWWLAGSSQQQSIYGGAHCIRRYGFGVVP